VNGWLRELTNKLKANPAARIKCLLRLWKCVLPQTRNWNKIPCPPTPRVPYSHLESINNPK